MKVVLLNGSPHREGCTYTALNEVRTTLESEGIATDMLWVGNGPVAGCTACGYCDRHNRCVVDDQVNALLDMPFDALVVGSPVYYGAASGQVTSDMLPQPPVLCRQRADGRALWRGGGVLPPGRGHRNL